MSVPGIETAAVGWPVTRLGVSFFPLYLASNGLPSIVTGEGSGLVVEELERARVGELHVRNPGDTPVLIVEGEHFLGGKQNRTVNVTILVASLADLTIPVSCLERGRWGRRRATVRDKAFEPASVRSMKNAMVNKSMRHRASRAGDQAAVWGEVDAMLDRASVDSGTAAAADVRKAAYRRERSRAEKIEELVKGGPLPGQCGFVVVRGGEVEAMDLFGAPDLLAAHWGGLIRSHLLESPSGETAAPSDTRVLEAVRRFANAEAEEAPGLGLGLEHRMDHDGLTGHALTLNGRVVHAAFFVRAWPKRGREPGEGRAGRGQPGIVERARGLMTGAAAGNLVGSVTEGWTRERIARRFPGGVGDIVAGEAGPDDGEIAQMIVVAEAAAEGPLDPDDLGRRFWEWAETNGAGMGRLTRDVLALHGGRDPRRQARAPESEAPREPSGLPITEASKAAWQGRRAGNGAAGRCAPLAVRWFDDPAALVRNAVISAVPTHWDWRCGWSCALLNLAAAAALRGESMTADELLAAGLDGVRAALPELRAYGYEARVPRSVAAAVLEAAELGIDDLGALGLDGETMGYTLHALKAGLVAYWRAPGFSEGLCRVAEAGGDTDTNGAVAGALLGAKFGIGEIPGRWRRGIREIRAGRDPISAHADRLLEVRREAGTR